MNYEQEYNRVMSLLRNTKMPHGLCEPRERKACTHCNAVEQLDELIAEYKGARVVLARPAPATTTRSCNRHSDCDAADAEVKARGGFAASHCHDETCEECFGN